MLFIFDGEANKRRLALFKRRDDENKRREVAFFFAEKQIKEELHFSKEELMKTKDG